MRRADLKKLEVSSLLFVYYSLKNNLKLTKIIVVIANILN